MTTTTRPGAGSERIRTLIRKAQADLNIPADADMTKAQVQAILPRVLAGLNTDLTALLEKRLKPAPPSQAQLAAVTEQVLKLDDKLCELERLRGLPERMPISKMEGLTLAEKIAEMARRGPKGAGVRKRSNGKTDWTGFLS